MCEYCYLEEVHIGDIPCCIIKSLSELYNEFCTSGSFNMELLTKKDRIYYILLLVILIISVRLLLRGKKYEQSDQPFWELDGRWNS